MRILTEIPDGDVKELDALASKKKSSRAAAIRDAVKLYLVHNADNNDWIQRGRGFWKGRKDIGDGLEYQNAIREDRTPYDEL
jgi:predicted transcriptional regulator